MRNSIFLTPAEYEKYADQLEPHRIDTRLLVGQINGYDVAFGERSLIEVRLKQTMNERTETKNYTTFQRKDRRGLSQRASNFRNTLDHWDSERPDVIEKLQG